MKKTKDHIKIKTILKYGNFTLCYHNKNNCELYEGKLKSYDDIPVDENEDQIEGIYLPNKEHGYIPSEVVYLVEALGGKVFTV